MNILLNLDNFHEDFIKFYLKDYINRKMSVLIIPFSFHEDYIKTPKEWDREYKFQKGEAYNKLTTPFLNYGIFEENIKWLNYFLDNRETAKRKIDSADIIYFQGGYPDKLMKRLKEFDIVDTIKNYKGIIMGASAGAMIQFKEYHLTPDDDYYEYGYYEGLGFIDDFEIEVHYRNTYEQRESMRRYFADRKKKIYSVGNEGAIVYLNGEIKTFGDVQLYNNLEELNNIKVVEGDNIYLRDLNDDDIETIWDSRMEIENNINRLFISDISQVEAMVREENNKNKFFAIMDKKTNTQVGYLYFKEKEYVTARIFINIFSEYEGNGFGTEAGHILLDYIFSTSNARRVEISINYLDEKTNNLLNNLGFNKEAHFKSKVYKIDEFLDELVYTVFKDDFYEITKDLRTNYNFDEFYNALENGHKIEIIYNHHKYSIFWDYMGHLVFCDESADNYFVYESFDQLISSVEIQGHNLYDLIENHLADSMNIIEETH